MSVFEEYNNIGKKVRRRIVLKSQNKTAAKNYFNLSSSSKKREQTTLQALCLLKSGELFLKTKDKLEAAHLFLESGRVFSKLDESDFSFFQHSKSGQKYFSYELIKCFNECIIIFQQNKMFVKCSTVCYEVGLFLMRIKNFEEAEKFFIRGSLFARKIFHFSSQIEALDKSIYCLLKIPDFKTAKKRIKYKIQILEHFKNQNKDNNIPYYSLFLLLLINGEYDMTMNCLEDWKKNEKMFPTTIVPLLHDLRLCCETKDQEGILEIVDLNLMDHSTVNQKLILKWIKTIFVKSEKDK